MTPDADSRWMRAALMLARSGLGTTGTNPSVGCIIVTDGRALGRGRTAKNGRPHAETLAIDDARNRFGYKALRGATAYVTLEPCAHHALTPPCADALVAAGIARVVAPMRDPDPRVSGKGFETLRNNGVQVDIGIEESDASETLKGYLSRTRHKRPYLTLKLAATLDGAIATRNGESKWITGGAARRRVHLLRARSDAIIIGIGSLLADDPGLDVRLPGLEQSSPRPVVADGRLQTPLTGQLARDAEARGLILLCREDAEPARIAAFRELGATVQPVPTTQDGLLSMHHALSALSDFGVGAILCEGGGRLAASLLRDRLVDELIWFSAGATMGGGICAISDFGVGTIAEMPRFAQVAVEQIGPDVMSVWRPEKSD